MTEDVNKKLMEFKTECINEFCIVLNEAGYATAEQIELEVLDQMADYIVRSFLSDEMYQTMFGQDVLQYCYIINSFCLEAGALFGDKIAEVGRDAELSVIDEHLREIPDEYFGSLIEGDVVELCEKLMVEKFGLMSEEEANAAIYTPVFRKWVGINQNNLGLVDGMNYVFVACLASFYVGVALTRAL